MLHLANLPGLLHSFFTARLMMQRKVSPHTIASYRDTFRLLLQFAHSCEHKLLTSSRRSHDCERGSRGACATLIPAIRKNSRVLSIHPN